MKLKQDKWYVGIDLGGTAIKLAIVNSNGEIAYKESQPTQVAEGGDRILHQMDEMIIRGIEDLALKKEDLQGIGIGAPAFLDLERGYVYEAVNLGWKDYPLKDRLEEITGLPVVVDNDANTAALGEMWKGAGSGASDLLVITLGTGVGGGVISKGKIFHGSRGTSGEIGHVTVVTKGGYRCNCGKQGCLETLASATGIVKLATDALKEGTSSTLAETLKANGALEAKDVAFAADAGDELALSVLDQVGFYLGWTLGNYAVLLNPEKIVVGGGVSRAGEVLFKPIRDYYRQYALPHLTGDIEIVAATLGNDAGVIGSAWLVHSKE
ncbi:ROK family glucokinase [Caldalkalibacillus mannanilyticus]|uniref:ROK family glucokinase n=1 Tax=Caldalkalibacillus mannanilyticus TaxID=1418 RepID=UPI003F6EEF39